MSRRAGGRRSGTESDFEEIGVCAEIPRPVVGARFRDGDGEVRVRSGDVVVLFAGLARIRGRG